jgi:hypothetical protein
MPPIESANINSSMWTARRVFLFGSDCIVNAYHNDGVRSPRDSGDGTLDRKIDMEVNFIYRVLVGERDLFYGGNSVKDCSESI